jgi:hypothetical protein
MITPAILQKGDTIAILATARKILTTILNRQIYYIVGVRSHHWEYHWFRWQPIGRNGWAKGSQQQLDNPNIKGIGAGDMVRSELSIRFYQV